MGIKLAIFDLDDTLINTSTFKSCRDKREWSKLDEYIDDFEEICNAKEAIDELKKNDIEIAIVTTSRTSYAKEVLKRFNIQYDQLFGSTELEKHYKDYTSSKTGTICKLKSEYGLKSSQILFIGDSYKDYKACEESNILFITHNNSEANKSFEGLLITLSSYLDLIPLIKEIEEYSFGIIDGYNKNIGDFKTLSYYLTDIYKPIESSIYTPTEDYENTKHEDDEDDPDPDIKFSYDAMHKRVKDLKKQNMKSVVNTINFLNKIKLKHHFPNIDYVVRALGSNELEYDKKSVQALDIIGFYIAKELKAEYKPEILTQQDTHDKFSHIKGLTYEERKEIIHGMYSCKDIDNKNVLLIDDVITTGATTEEIKRAIKEENPSSKIKLFSFAKSKKYTKDRYIKNIVNTKYFACAHSDFSDRNWYQCSLVHYLKQIIDKDKCNTIRKDGYKTMLLNTKGISVLGQDKKYTYFSIRRVGTTLKINKQKFSRFNSLDKFGLYKYMNTFIDESMEKIN